MYQSIGKQIFNYFESVQNFDKGIRLSCKISAIQ